MPAALRFTLNGGGEGRAGVRSAARSAGLYVAVRRAVPAGDLGTVRVDKGGARDAAVRVIQNGVVPRDARRVAEDGGQRGVARGPEAVIVGHAREELDHLAVWRRALGSGPAHAAVVKVHGRVDRAVDVVAAEERVAAAAQQQPPSPPSLPTTPAAAADPSWQELAWTGAKRFTAGAVAGVAECLVGHPLDTVRALCGLEMEGHIPNNASQPNPTAPPKNTYL